MKNYSLTRPLRQHTLATMPDAEIFYIAPRDIKVCTNGYFIRKSARVHKTTQDETYLGVTKWQDAYAVAFDQMVFHDIYSAPWQYLWFTLLAWCGVYTPFQSHDGIDEFDPITQILRLPLPQVLDFDYQFVCETKKERTLAINLAKTRVKELSDDMEIDLFVLCTLPYLDPASPQGDIPQEIRQMITQCIKKRMKKFIKFQDTSLMLDYYCDLILFDSENFFAPYCNEVEQQVIRWIHGINKDERLYWQEEIRSAILEYHPKEHYDWLQRLILYFETEVYFAKKKPIKQVKQKKSPYEQKMEEIQKLDGQRREFVKQQKFEEAARVRDEIIKLRATLQPDDKKKG